MQLKRRYLIAAFTFAVAGLGAFFHHKTKLGHEPAGLTEYTNTEPSNTGGLTTPADTLLNTPSTATTASAREAPADLTQQIILDAISLHDLRQAMNTHLPPDRRLEHLDFFMQNMGEEQDNLARIAKEFKTTPDALAGLIRHIATESLAEIREQLQKGVPDIIDRFALTFAAEQYGHYTGLQGTGQVVHAYAQQMNGWEENELKEKLHSLYTAAEAAAKRELDMLPKDNSQLTEQQVERFIRASLFSALAYDPIYDETVKPGMTIKEVDNSWMTEFNKRLTEMYKIRDRHAATAAARDRDMPVGILKP